MSSYLPACCPATHSILNVASRSYPSDTYGIGITGPAAMYRAIHAEPGWDRRTFVTCLHDGDFFYQDIPAAPASTHPTPKTRVFMC